MNGSSSEPGGNVQPLRTPKKQTNDRVIQGLRDAVEDAESGVAAAACVVVKPDGSIGFTHWPGDDFHRLLGALEQLKHRLLEQVEE